MVDPVATHQAEEEAQTPYDASDPQQVNTARKKASRKNAKRLEVVAALMQHKDGRRWIHEQLDWCHIYGNPVIPGDTHATYFNLGQENIGKRLLADVVAAAPEQYILMLQEAKESK